MFVSRGVGEYGGGGVGICVRRGGREREGRCKEREEERCKGGGRKRGRGRGRRRRGGERGEGEKIYV